MTKAIIFDFWGTLVENGVWSPTKQVQNILNIRLPFSEYVVRMEKAMMTSSFESLNEAFRAVCTEFTLEPKDPLIDQLVGMWNKNWMLARPFPDVQETLQKLQEKYMLILISNTDSFSVEKVLDKYMLRPYFSHVFLSHQVGLLKNDPAFLQKVLEALQLSAEDCLLIGDSIESDMEAAGKAGIQSILIDWKNARDYTPKIGSLNELKHLLEEQGHD